MYKEQLEAALKNSQSKACKFFATNEFVLDHAETIKPVKGKRGDGSKNSFQFQIKPTSEALSRLFKITPTEDFEARFEEAVSGDGQEAQRITRLGSSSLLAFLCFNGVSKDHPLTISWSPNASYVFDEVHFECQNPITPDRNTRCSNIDILLIGNNENNKGKRAALFLESKFSEYFGRSSSYKDISNVYKDAYNAFFPETRSWDSDSLRWQPGEDESGNKTIELYTTGDTQYCSGIKQMISHSQGLKTLADDRTLRSESKQIEVFSFNDFDEVFLGSIVFNFDTKVSDRKGAFKAYKELYKKFVDHFPWRESFHVVPELLTYQDVFAQGKFPLTAEVRAMYFPQTLKTRQ